MYLEIQTNMRNREWLCERVILVPTNENIGQINEKIISNVVSDAVEYLSVDYGMDTEQVTLYPVSS